MNLLAELHQEQDLKLNLKFEIEVLCKTLTIELHSLQPGNLLKDTVNQILNVRSFGVVPKQPMLAGPPPSGPPPQSVRMMTSSAPMGDPMGGGGGNMPMMMMAGSHGPGSAGAGMGAALMATPQQPPMGPQGFMPPTSGQPFGKLTESRIAWD